MNELNKNILDFSSVNKDRIYKDFNAILYREFNESLFETNLYFGLREDYFFEILEKAYLENGPYTMRQEFNYIVKLLKLIFYKVENNDLFNFYEYSKNCTYGHFGNKDVPWEKIGW